MPDWPVSPTSLLNMSGVLHSIGWSSCAYDPHAVTQAFSGSGNGTWPAANRAIYIPFMVEARITVYQIAVEVAVQSGSLDVGLYDLYGKRLQAAGSTAVAVAGVQAIDITDTALTPGVYYMGMCVDNNTASFYRSTAAARALQMAGVQQQAVGAVTLPDPATFANPASAYIPHMSLALTATL